ncbi:MAG: hydrogenase 3 maturation endopeptidase HyCI [Elusimicrobiales bacterium]|jgi:hydrogenase 3 maturation protease
MSNFLTDGIKAAIAPKGRTLLITIGNSLRADDGLGPFVGEQVRCKNPAFLVINAYTTPENIAQTAIDFKPEKIILLDAAHFGGRPGEMRIIPLDLINRQTVISTHSFPLSVTFSIVKEDTGAELVALGVQPASMEYEEGLTPAVKESALSLIEYFSRMR